MGKITDAEKKREYADYDGFSSQPLYESFSVIFAEATRLDRGGMRGIFNSVIGDGYERTGSQ